MFFTDEFIYNNISSKSFGLVVADFGSDRNKDVAFGNGADIFETRTATRVTPIHNGVNYNSKPLQFDIVFGSDKQIDRPTMEAISYWLTGHQDYQWLRIAQYDMSDIEYKCIVSKLEPITHGWMPTAFKATFTCDCPYAYTQEKVFEYSIEAGAENDLILNNNSSVREYFKPIITITKESGEEGSFSIINTSDKSRISSFASIPASVTKVIIDCENCTITALTSEDAASEVFIYDKFNMNFPRFVSGVNNISITSSFDCSVSMSGRLFRNVAG